MINLPHKEPLIFAKDIIQKDEKSVTVLCEFDEIPSLPIFLEAAAQSSIAFNQAEEKPKIGFLTMAKNIIQHNEFQDKSYFIKVESLVVLENLRQFSFEVTTKDSDIVYVTGSFSIFIQV